MSPPVYNLTCSEPGQLTYGIIGLFVVVRAAAIGHWRLAKVEERWSARTADTG
ncbi:hypothetical protein [Streptomyces sp. MUSC 14]|uniref:hypothetical protein n=1 Tax=Streptomyces sp. MUSC 14 TaxID=1354889 RepID=UPI0015A61E86|nr:hypothetical protein [Streptomyces sp. MUSC 14]